ncbi:uncharacterized protein LOC121375344 [Gigantopelta aegis]|uniref:uncharacterized protein LOC121375344 n=1 Tax=Gigantopelta aegis TaxID=1735272 RepID=UPI001B88E29A|nr:uncharacterized protein LOC121375344 [Gigantopelta aegis]
MSSNPKQKTKYVLVKTIYTKLPGDKEEPCTIDMTVLCQGDMEVIVVVDFNNKALKAYWTCPGQTRDLSSCCLEFEHHPRRVTNVTENQVVVTFWDEPEVAVVNVLPELRLKTLVSTQNRQCGVAVIPGTVEMDDHKFVFASENRIAIHDSDGYILKRICSPNDKHRQRFPVPWYLSMAANNDILVSDFEKGGVTCVTQTGNDKWFYQTEGTPRGVTCDSDGYVYVVEGVTNRVTLLTPSGDFISSVLREDTKLPCIYGLAFGNSGKLYLSEYHGQIGIFNLIKNTDA